MFNVTNVSTKKYMILNVFFFSEGADHLVLQQIQMIVPVVLGILLVVVLVAGVAVCLKRSEFLRGFNEKEKMLA